MKNLLILLFLIMGFTSGFAQTRTYAVKVVGIKVGEIEVSKNTKADTTTYKLSSQVDVNFLVYHLKVDYRVKSVYSKGNFIGSEVKVVSNRGNYFTKTVKEGDHYLATSKQIDKDVNRKIDQNISSSFAHLYFNEPLKTDKVYAEFYADFIQLTALENHHYLGELDKNIDEYYFENGLLVKMVKKNPITDMVIVYQPPNKK
ncbi:DUF6134 family protein [Jiulongibacter sp. NS-SX5]|uniref:DUF6134 family protein n=1 Tax=Jiulongibacter sp. NS-SX5 TaxID=3463854 RepID=UPI004058D34E